MRYLFIIEIALFTNSFLFAQDLDSISEAETQARKDSIYSNRFNEGNFQIGGVPLLILSGGDAEGFYPTGYGAHLEFGYFLKNRFLFLVEHTTLYYKYEYKPTPVEGKAHYMYSTSSPGIRYYLRPRRFTFFAQTFVNYSYNSEDRELIDDFPPIDFSRIDIMPGIGATFCTNVIDISLECNYAFPIYYSKEVNTERLSYHWNKGLQPMVSFFFTF